MQQLQALLKEAEATLAGKDTEMQQLQVRCVVSGIPEFGSARGLTHRLQALVEEASAAVEQRRAFLQLNAFAIHRSPV